MRSMIVLVVVAAAVAWAAIRHLPAGEAEATPARIPAQEIQSVSIDGRRLPLADLRALLATRPGDLLDDARLERDRAALEAALSARGHLAARVEPADVVYGEAGGAYVTFDVVQGPVFKLRSVTVTGATEREAGVVTLNPGDDASARRIERARQTLEEMLVHRGTPARVTVAIHVDRPASVVDVELAVER